MQPSIEAGNKSIPQTAVYLLLQSDLLQALYRHHCPTSQRLSDFHLGILADLETQMVQLHLTQCPHCAFELEELAQFLVKFTPVSRGKSLDRMLPQT